MLSLQEHDEADGGGYLTLMYVKGLETRNTLVPF